MKHVLVTRADPADQLQMMHWMRSTLGQQMFDADVLDHRSTFTLKASARGISWGFLPVQQPLMLESLAFNPGLTEAEQAFAMTKLAEHAIEEAYRRDAAEVYFLSQNHATAHFAERHHFRRVDLPLYRFNLREWERSE